VLITGVAAGWAAGFREGGALAVAAGGGGGSGAAISAGFLAQAAKAMRVKSGTNLRTSTSIEVRSRNRERHDAVGAAWPWRILGRHRRLSALFEERCSLEIETIV
jgi:hypothetical protein